MGVASVRFGGLDRFGASAKHLLISLSSAEALFVVVPQDRSNSTSFEQFISATSESSTLIRPMFRTSRISLSFNHFEHVVTFVGSLV